MTDSGRENNPNALLQTMDGKVWADEFCRITGFTDRSWALSWFCNAIMTGYDFGKRRAADQAAEHSEDAAEAIYPGWKLLKELVGTS